MLGGESARRSSLLGRLLRRGRARGVSGGSAAVARRAAHRRGTAGNLAVGWVARDGGSRVDGGRTSNHLGRRGAVRAGLGERTGATERCLAVEV